MTTYHEWPTLKVGSRGDPVLRLQQLLAGGNRFAYQARPGPVDGVFGETTAAAVKRYKWFVGYAKDEITGRCGERLRGFMVARGYPAFTPLTAAMMLRKRRRRGSTYDAVGDRYPLAVHGPIIGIPYVGTHLDFHNWESDNAIDIAVPIGTIVRASIRGYITSQIGPLSSSNPQLLGQRLHVRGDSQELYYAHLSRINVTPGQHVEVGDRLGLSGSANGVQHLHFATQHGDPALLIGEPASPNYVDRHYPG
jgi:murein DD-endopeptidase MepM/ murein hydrolase activator NlpD